MIVRNKEWRKGTAGFVIEDGMIEVVFNGRINNVPMNELEVFLWIENKWMDLNEAIKQGIVIVQNDYLKEVIKNKTVERLMVVSEVHLKGAD